MLIFQYLFLNIYFSILFIQYLFLTFIFDYAEKTRICYNKIMKLFLASD